MIIIIHISIRKKKKKKMEDTHRNQYHRQFTFTQYDLSFLCVVPISLKSSNEDASKWSKVKVMQSEIYVIIQFNNNINVNGIELYVFYYFSSSSSYFICFPLNNNNNISHSYNVTL